MAAERQTLAGGTTMSYIRRRGRQSWQVQVELSSDPITGKRRRRLITVRGTKRDAERALTVAEYERDHGFDVAPDRITVPMLLDRWLRDYAAVSVAPATLKRYTELASAAGRLIGDVRAQDLRPAHVQALHARLIERGLAARTVLHHHRVLREALGWAVRMQLLATNPADAVSPPRPTHREMQTLDVAGLTRLLAACLDDEQRRLVYVAVQTGMRIGELLALRWADLDLDSGRASVSRSLQWLKGELSVRSPKTARGRRSIALSPETVETLLQQRSIQRERRLRAGEAYAQQDPSQDLVWADELGHPKPPHAVSIRFSRMARSHGFENFRFHDLRHTSATLALQAGIHPKVVSERLGHATIAITLDTYSHVLPDMQRAAADALDAVLGKAPSSGRA